MVSESDIWLIVLLDLRALSQRLNFNVYADRLLDSVEDHLIEILDSVLLPTSDLCNLIDYFVQEERVGSWICRQKYGSPLVYNQYPI